MHSPPLRKNYPERHGGGEGTKQAVCGPEAFPVTCLVFRRLPNHSVPFRFHLLNDDNNRSYLTECREKIK